jgi:hypothetical protein
MKKLIYLLSLLILSSCVDKPGITKNDLVKKYVIDSITKNPQIYFMDYDPSYYVHLSSGDKFTTKRKDIYKVGDSITYVYKDYQLKNH